MKVAKLKIKNFRGISSTELYFSNHSVLIGDNNSGKSTVFEALDLVLGPDRVHRKPVIDEHDFFNGKYIEDEEGSENPKINIEAIVIDLNSEQQTHFRDNLEWWDIEKNILHTSTPPESVDDESIKEALRVTFIGEYDIEEDDFIGKTIYTRSILESDNPQIFSKRDKQKCGFLYLRALRTGSRALSLEKGSLLDIILRIKEIRPQMWEKTISELSKFGVASDSDIGISDVLESIEKAMKKFVPKEWGISPHLRISNLTREHLRKIITAFIGTGSDDHAAPFYRQGTGTINILVLAMLSQIAEEKQNVIFAMEEPEIAIPPYTQKQIIHEVKNLSSQCLFTSHSPYVIEEFDISETLVLSRDKNSKLIQKNIELPDGLKLKRYRQEFRKSFCEGLLARRVLITEGETEASSIPAVARRLAELNSSTYTSLEALGISVINAGSDSKIIALANLYKKLGKEVYALCDKQSDENEKKIEERVDHFFMHEEKGFEQLILKNTTKAAKIRFINLIDWPTHLISKYPDPKDEPNKALLSYFRRLKGNLGIADFLAQCEESEIPEWIKETCIKLKDLSISE